MYGQGAQAHVPSPEALAIIKNEPIKELANEKLKDLGFDGTWTEQKELVPIIGFPVYFISVKMDAGWFRTSMVKSFGILKNGDLTITTCNSVYKAVLHKDKEKK